MASVELATLDFEKYREWGKGRVEARTSEWIEVTYWPGGHWGGELLRGTDLFWACAIWLGVLGTGLGTCLNYAIYWDNKVF